MKKAQNATEFVLILTGGLLVFTSILIGVQLETIDAKNNNKEIIAQTIADKVSEELALAQASSFKYYRTFYLPVDAYGTKYNVSLNHNTLAQPLELVVTIDNEQFIYYINYSVDSTSTVSLGANAINREEDGSIHIEGDQAEQPTDYQCGSPNGYSGLLDACSVYCGAEQACEGATPFDMPCIDGCSTGPFQCGSPDGYSETFGSCSMVCGADFACDGQQPFTGTCTEGCAPDPFSCSSSMTGYSQTYYQCRKECGAEDPPCHGWEPYADPCRFGCFTFNWQCHPFITGYSQSIGRCATACGAAPACEFQPPYQEPCLAGCT